MRLTQRASAALLGLVVLTTGCAATTAGAVRPDDRLVDQDVPGAGPDGLGGFAALPSDEPVGDLIKDDCRPRSGPPYQIGAVGTFGGGSVRITEAVSVSGISGRFCAVATVEPPPPDGSHPLAKVCTHLVAPQDGLEFDDVRTEITIIPGVTSVIGKVDIEPVAFDAFVCDDGEPGQLKLDTTIRASAAPELFGTRCLVGPIEAVVTGSFTGPLTNARATLSSDRFPVHAVQAEPPACPQGLAQNTNIILGLPLQASAAPLTINTAARLYLAKY